MYRFKLALAGSVVLLSSLFAGSVVAGAGQPNQPVPPLTVDWHPVFNPSANTVTFYLKVGNADGYFKPFLPFPNSTQPTGSTVSLQGFTGDSGYATVTLTGPTTGDNKRLPCPGFVDVGYFAPNGPSQGPGGNYGDVSLNITDCTIPPPPPTTTPTVPTTTTTTPQVPPTTTVPPVTAPPSISQPGPGTPAPSTYVAPPPAAPAPVVTAGPVAAPPAAPAAAAKPLASTGAPVGIEAGLGAFLVLVGLGLVLWARRRAAATQ